jgi:nitroreductase
MTVFSAAVLAGSSLLEGCSPATAEQPSSPTTAPAAAGSATLSEAFRNRKSTNAFQSQPLPKELLLDLLWAAWGINRPDSGKRTAPSAMNTQEIDLYVLLPDGAYVYEAKQNQLTPVSDQDLRAKTGAMKFQDVPVHLIFVADYAKYRMGTQSQKELWSSAHTGFIGQNVYLYCAANGLGAHFYAGIDGAALKDSLKLRADQAVLFGQAVGYPNE